MPAPTVRTDYDSLAEIATIFNQQADGSRRTLQRLQQRMETLQGGDWIGKGAAAFYQEMNSDVLPAVTRLVAALEQAHQATQRISQIMKEAEDEASDLFRGVLAAAAAGGVVVGAAVGVAPSASLRAGVGGDAGGVEGGASGTGVGGTPGGGAGGQPGGASSSGAGGSGGAGGAAGPSGQNPLLATDPGQLFTDSYMRGMIGLTFSGADSPELRDAMSALAKNPTGQELERILRRIAQLRGQPYNKIKADYEKFLKIQAQAVATAAAKGLPPPPALSDLLHGDFMGSTPQMRYGKVVGDAFGVDPVFGALLNPTGGLVGNDNIPYQPANDSAAGYHGVFHDAGGYLNSFHNAGPGYNYLGQEDGDASSPLTGQTSGLRYWSDKVP